MFEWVSQTCSSIKTIFGMPDYQKYLEHHRTAHPDRTPMTEKEYYMYALKNRYNSGSFNRCC
jgi:uncharacterized short protein YbdD (DUF466 family)